jgi:hypothetical protein
MRRKLLAFSLLLAACEPPVQSRQTPTTPPRADVSSPRIDAATQTVGAEGVLRFCAYGGQGVMAVDANPEALHRAVAVVTVPPLRATEPPTLALRELVLRDGGGAIVSQMRALISVTRVDLAPDELTWASAMNAQGTPWRGVVEPGGVTIRIEAWLTTRPRTLATRAEVTLTGSGVTVRAVGAVAGEWPTG